MKTVLISVFNKNNIGKLGKFLKSKQLNIISTGGTFKKLVDETGPEQILQISSLTNFPEILNGRVKSLHPKIHGGLLAKRDNMAHMDELNKHDIVPIDILIVNLYPFEETVQNKESNEEVILEDIDIGGHTLIRAAAKNYKDVIVITDPNDYDNIMDKWDNLNSLDLRRYLAKKAFNHITRYDMAISSYFDKDSIFRWYKKERHLKYGTNPQQYKAGLYKNVLDSNKNFPFKVLNGNPGYINFLDAIYGWNLVCELNDALHMPACASYKHNSPAGVGVSIPLDDLLKKIYFVSNKDLTEVATAYVRAHNVDPMSSFGDFIAINGIVDECTAKLIKCEVSDGIIASGYTNEALNILKEKKKGSYVILEGDKNFNYSNLEIREMHGVTLIQDENKSTTTKNSFNDIVTYNKNLNEEIIRDLIIANITLKYTQSNSVCSAKDGQVLGVGAGQQSRIDCVKLVKRKTLNWYLKQHPKCIKILSTFRKDVKKADKINAIIQYIDGNFTKTEYENWLKLFDGQPISLTDIEKETFLSTLSDVSLASDAFFPFRDNIDIASQFGVKYIVQPGGSIKDSEIIQACDEYGMIMAHTGREMRMFLH